MGQLTVGAESVRLNLGCGERAHPAWVNIDIAPRSPLVIQHDLRKGVPCDDCSAHAVYLSHVLEHIHYDRAPGFLQECHRVLIPGGVIRVVVPDLEIICRLYLQKLDQTLAGIPGAADDCDWMRMELIDQMTREISGGLMQRELRRADLPNRAFILQRIGAAAGAPIASRPSTSSKPNRHRQFGVKLRSLPDLLRRVAIRLVLSREQRAALLIGSFRNSGEIHQWMYDRESLARLLKGAGFNSPAVRHADDSLIPGWPEFGLDANQDGHPVKPDSLFMEAIKPKMSS